ncbi:MAG TPA: hypothetical protein PLX85_09910, partial [Dehalococcoidia bacterium]|nr:hypothetical protein [Dehalococcoidia bacterium]
MGDNVGMTIPPRPPGPIAALRRIAYLLEYAGESSYRASAFRRAADAVAELAYEDLRARAEGLDITCKVGFLERPERVVLLIIG